MADKVALVHYWLTNMRGGENVLAEIASLYPDADIFTHACNTRVMAPVFGGRRITETFIGKLPGARKNCQKYLPLMPAALRMLDLKNYDLIISSESGPAKGIRKPSGARHICYCHTPMRYLWDMYDEYYRNAGLAGKAAMRIFGDCLRRYDRRSAESVDLFIANSKFVAERIKRIYNRESVVVHPPADYDFFAGGRFEKKDYYLLAGQLTAYKRPELAVEACLALGRKLVVVGCGEMERELKRRAAGRGIFLGRVSRETLRRCYAEARALLFPGVEDFGIVPLEAQSAGTPVIALGVGGACETVVNGETGLFFRKPAVEDLREAILEFERCTWSSEACRKNAARFTPNCFRKRFAAAAANVEA